ncbi:MAG: mannose-6-phosphate isomerase, class I [Chloroflexi bacterium]|nr:mannose-6-phosphate isomerase, class I [Chloroflexota bacterium]
MGATVYPLTFEPVFRDYVWGGRRLETLYGRALPPGIVAESWEISGHASSPTRVDAGPLQGRTLPEVLDAWGLDLVGAHSAAMLARGRFPLLVKLLDANQPLSVQVHPDDAYAGEHEHGELGKTEMWHVLHADPGAELVYGLAEGVTRESFARALETRTLEGQLRRVRVRAGDSVYVPAGTVHALLAGTVVAEIQQNSDTTYRVYDWGRLGPDGKPRALHVAQALDVIDWGSQAPQIVRPRPVEVGTGFVRRELVRAAPFVVEQVELAAGATYHGECAGASFELWGCVEGTASVRSAHGEAALPAVRFCVLPAALGAFTVRATRACACLRAYVAASRS